jgi:two-component system chemotaxis response regulator CheY
VLLDMHMPRMSGPETVRAIRANPAYRGVKLFAVTGSSPAEMGVAIGPDGVDHWIQKPFKPQTLVDELNRDFALVC